MRLIQPMTCETKLLPEHEIIAGIVKVIDSKDVCCIADIEDDVDPGQAVAWLAENLKTTNNPIEFLGKYWQFYYVLTYCYDSDDYFPNNHPIWVGDYQLASRHIATWVMLNNSGMVDDSIDDYNAKQDFDEWIARLSQIPEKYRLAICCKVGELFNSDGGNAHDGNFEMSSPVDMVVNSLDDAKYTIIKMTGSYSVEDLQSLLEEMDKPRPTVDLPAGTYVPESFDIN